MQELEPLFQQRIGAAAAAAVTTTAATSLSVVWQWHVPGRSADILGSVIEVTTTTRTGSFPLSNAPCCYATYHYIIRPQKHKHKHKHKHKTRQIRIRMALAEHFKFVWNAVHCDYSTRAFGRFATTAYKWLQLNV